MDEAGETSELEIFFWPQHVEQVGHDFEALTVCEYHDEDVIAFVLREVACLEVSKCALQAGRIGELESSPVDLHMWQIALDFVELDAEVESESGTDVVEVLGELLLLVLVQRAKLLLVISEKTLKPLAAEEHLVENAQESGGKAEDLNAVLLAVREVLEISDLGERQTVHLVEVKQLADELSGEDLGELEVEAEEVVVRVVLVGLKRAVVTCVELLLADEVDRCVLHVSELAHLALPPYFRPCQRQTVQQAVDVAAEFHHLVEDLRVRNRLELYLKVLERQLQHVRILELAAVHIHLKLPHCGVSVPIETRDVVTHTLAARLLLHAGRRYVLVALLDREDEVAVFFAQLRQGLFRRLY